jgi:hypothetical protein
VACQRPPFDGLNHGFGRTPGRRRHREGSTSRSGLRERGSVPARVARSTAPLTSSGRGARVRRGGPEIRHGLDSGERSAATSAEGVMPGRGSRTPPADDFLAVMGGGMAGRCGWHEAWAELYRCRGPADERSAMPSRDAGARRLRLGLHRRPPRLRHQRRYDPVCSRSRFRDAGDARRPEDRGPAGLAGRHPHGIRDGPRRLRPDRLPGGRAAATTDLAGLNRGAAIRSCDAGRTGRMLRIVDNPSPRSPRRLRP